jgi:hypothetical protein
LPLLPLLLPLLALLLSLLISLLPLILLLLLPPLLALSAHAVLLRKLLGSFLNYISCGPWGKTWRLWDLSGERAACFPRIPLLAFR